MQTGELLQQFWLVSKDQIIQLWVLAIDNHFQEIPHTPPLRRIGELFLDILFDFDTPIEENSAFPALQHSLLELVGVQAPIIDVLKISHLLRECFMDQIWPFVMKHDLDLKHLHLTIPVIHRRLDQLQSIIWNAYLNPFDAVTVQNVEENSALQHKERLTLLGKMAASMAHELRNPLTAIEGFLKLIRANLPSDASTSIPRYLDVIENEFDNLYRQISGFLSFSKSNIHEENQVLIDLPSLVHSVLILNHPRLDSESIEVELDFGDHPALSVPKVSFQQVISNLLNNSIDALSTMPHPRKIILSSNEDEQYIFLQIRDNGPGIPELMQTNIFTPFVTGKSNGTGLGLAICKQIMDKHGGGIDFTSHTGETVFTLSFNKQTDPVNAVSTVELFP
ncbi:sensor histidine kinase [Paenibacillus sp. y28]|uniref:sensor histidine kinase n=1 Tax=Paenibacillus sp. y28 TaxID=3129110 RepID=UPI003017E0A1